MGVVGSNPAAPIEKSIKSYQSFISLLLKLNNFKELTITDKKVNPDKRNSTNTVRLDNSSSPN